MHTSSKKRSKGAQRLKLKLSGAFRKPSAVSTLKGFGTLLVSAICERFFPYPRILPSLVEIDHTADRAFHVRGRNIWLLACALAIGFVLVATAQQRQRKGTAMAFHFESPAFQAGGAIPREFTCEGSDHSPELKWGEPPQGTRSFALIVDDPDAPVGTWVHWVVYNLPATLRKLPQGVPTTGKLEGGGLQGINDFRRTGYGGPCPPPGKPHRYFFKLYALDTELNLKPGSKKAEIEQGMQGHVLAGAELMGTFRR